MYAFHKSQSKPLRTLINKLSVCEVVINAELNLGNEEKKCCVGGQYVLEKERKKMFLGYLGLDLSKSPYRQQMINLIKTNLRIPLISQKNVALKQCGEVRCIQEPIL